MGRSPRRSIIVLLAAVAIFIAPDVGAEESSAGVRLPFVPSVEMSQVIVVRGDHLWKISERHLETVRGSDVNTVEVASYWLRVIEQNQSSLRSGDPDLIYPGEVIALPPSGAP